MPVDSAARNPEFQRLIRLQTEAFARNTPYHSLELNDGTVIPGLIPLTCFASAWIAIHCRRIFEASEYSISARPPAGTVSNASAAARKWSRWITSNTTN